MPDERPGRPAPPTPAAPTPLLTGRPWELAGISRTAWYRLAAAGLTPKPVSLPGTETRWRAADVAKWVAGLATTGRRRRGAPARSRQGGGDPPGGARADHHPA